MFPTAESHRRHEEALDRILAGQQPFRNSDVASTEQLAAAIEKAAKDDYESGSDKYEGRFNVRLSSLSDFCPNADHTARMNCYRFESYLREKLDQHFDLSQLDYLLSAEEDNGWCAVRISVWPKLPYAYKKRSAATPPHRKYDHGLS